MVTLLRQLTQNGRRKPTDRVDAVEGMDSLLQLDDSDVSKFPKKGPPKIHQRPCRRQTKKGSHKIEMEINNTQHGMLDANLLRWGVAFSGVFGATQVTKAEVGDTLSS